MQVPGSPGSLSQTNSLKHNHFNASLLSTVSSTVHSACGRDTRVQVFDGKVMRLGGLLRHKKDRSRVATGRVNRQEKTHRLEAIGRRLEAIAIRLEAIASRLVAICLVAWFWRRFHTNFSDQLKLLSFLRYCSPIYLVLGIAAFFFPLASQEGPFSSPTNDGLHLLRKARWLRSNPVSFPPPPGSCRWWSSGPHLGALVFGAEASFVGSNPRRIRNETYPEQHC